MWDTFRNDSGHSIANGKTPVYKQKNRDLTLMVENPSL